MVLGGAPNAKLAPMGDIYFAFAFSTQFAYLLTNEWGVNVDSNSYGTSTTDNDGMDAASIEADSLFNGFGNALTPLFSTGNGAPGFGTATAPAPTSGINVGASTNFGSSGWDSIANYSQVTDNDVIEWSNRGPGANGRNGVDVVADGSYAPGDATLNTIIDGRNAWVTWGGTSRSTPVARRRSRARLPGLQGEARRVPDGADGEGDHEVVGERPRLRQLHAGLGIDRRRQGGCGSDRHSAPSSRRTSGGRTPTRR